MFSKHQAKPAASGLSSSDLAVLSEPGHGRKSPRVASLIASDIAIDGDLRGDGELQVDGVIRGDVSVARLTIGESGQVEGSVHAESVEVRGRVLGAVTAKQVRLYASAHVDGDITHEQLTMEAGAFFEGRSLKFQRTPLPVTGDVIDLSAAS